jgi:alcohol dehydrogenase
MKAVYYEAFQTPPAIVSLPDPTPSPGGVVIKVSATGLCRSDYHGWLGHDSDIHLPHVPGHELAGTIVAVGANVRNWHGGDRVTVPFVGGCGACPECQAGDHQVCAHQFQPGFTAWGSFAEYVAIDYADTNLVALPESISDATAAALGCRFVTSFRAVVDQGRLKPGEWIAVHGCGGVGLSAIMIARAMGARIIAIDLAEDKLAMARRLGAHHTINGSTTPDVPAAIRDLTHGGCHVSVDALGHPETCRNSILGLKRRGRHVQVGLLLAGHASPPVPMSRVIAHELEIYGSHGMQAHRYPAMLAMITSGALDPALLIGREISLADAPQALMAMDRFEGVGMTVITRF